MFLNAGCKFQDQGGISIGDGTLIGHNVVLATLNRDQNPANRGALHPAPIAIGKNVWIGANAVVLAGVTVGDGAIIAAGASFRLDGNNLARQLLRFCNIESLRLGQPKILKRSGEKLGNAEYSPIINIEIIVFS